MPGTKWVTNDVITFARMNQKTLIIQAAEPAIMYPGMCWLDVDDDMLYQRDAANAAWDTIIKEELAYTITGLHTFDRGANPPFAVGAASLKVTNLDADKLDGQSRVLKIDADHDHSGAGAEGGTLDAAAIAAGILAVARGGTGLGAYAQGGILYISAANTLSRLAPAAANRVLRSTAANALELAALLAADIPNLNASKINAGQFPLARMPRAVSGQFLEGNGAAADPIYNTLAVGDIPNLSTAKLTDIPAAAWATIFSNAFTIATVLTDHNKAAHDALSITPEEMDPSPDANNTGSELHITTDTVGENVDPGEVLYLKGDGKYWLADADGVATMPALVMAMETIVADAAGKLLHSGYFRHDAWNWAPGNGEANLLWASVTPGAMSQTQPVGAGDQAQVLGYVRTADIVFFNPSYELVEVS